MTIKQFIKVIEVGTVIKVCGFSEFFSVKEFSESFDNTRVIIDIAALGDGIIGIILQ